MTTRPEPRQITILGSTGSIGRSALEVVRRHPEMFRVGALAAHSNAELLHGQIAEFHPGTVALCDEAAAARLRAMNPGCRVLSGPKGLDETAALPADTVLCAVVGAAGLAPLLAAIDAGNRVAVANKEPLVMAGRLVMERARARGVDVLPVDSEHNAVFQCLQGQDIRDVRCIHLTASGGPFYGMPHEALRFITPAQATRHPTWKMGAKISVDSATLMNKGLEIVEAMWLFGLPQDRIEVVIHPQSTVHSMVEFNDGNILAQLGVTDMKTPILYALAWPDRAPAPIARLDLKALSGLTFAEPCFDEFPCLALARRAAAEGGTATAVLNAANEEAVSAFCGGRLPFLGIADVVAAVCGACPAEPSYDLASVLDADRRARAAAAALIAEMELETTC
jgi:1-deoxy-D-xylulose-5-phosphate reductoisomerase